MSILELNEVSYHVGALKIIDRVSWTVRRGQHWTVLGPNGSGKTTLLKLACGYLWPNAGGTILRDGAELVDLRELRRSIGWVSSSLVAQIPTPEPALDTVVSGRYAQTGLKMYGAQRPTARDRDDAEQMLADLDAGDLAKKPFGVLSQGEQQKVLLARARMAAPLLIILDEPCSGLDPSAREHFLGSLQQLADSPGTPSLVLVTHHLEEIMPAFSHLLALKAGRVARSGPATQVVDEALMVELYGIDQVRLIRSHGRCWPVW